MHTSNFSEDKWREVFREAILELDPEIFQHRLEAAKKAIDDRLQELRFRDKPDPREMLELSDARHTLLILSKEETIPK